MKQKDYNIISTKLKEDANILPFLTFPLTKMCNFRCVYCGEGGELSASMCEFQDFEKLKEKIIVAHRLGIRKFRLTGGEPFLYPHIKELLQFFNELGVYTLVNTNASLVAKNKDIIDELESNITFAVSLDSLKPDVFDAIVNRKNMYDRVIEGIKILSSANRLLRINMVVTRLNYEEVWNIIDFCSNLKCNLKLLDVVSVPLPYGNRKDLHISFTQLEEKLTVICDSKKVHQYSRGFGTPCFIYKHKGVEITAKSTWNGSHYDVNGICKSCNYFPCHEGLYDIFSLPDERIVGCRWSEESVEKKGISFEERLLNIAKVFQRADFCSREQNDAMKPYPTFVTDSLNKIRKE